MSSLILRRHVYSSRGVPARFASKSTSTTTSSSSVPSASKKVLKLTTTPLPTPPKVRAPFSRAARQPNRHDYLAHEQKIKAAQEAALAQAKAKLASSQKAKEKAAKAAAAADAAAAPEHASSWAVSAVASSMRVLTGKARLAAKLVGIADPAVASAASRAQHPLASGVSSFGSATRMLVFQRGDVETGSNALTADTLRHTDAILRKWSGDSLAHSIVLQSDSTETFSIGADMVTWLAAHDGLARPAHADASDNAFQGDNSLNAFLNAGARLAHTLSTTGSPVITLGGGLTAGAAAGIFLGGSIRAVAANSLFSVPDVAVGLSPASGTAVWLSRLSGSSSLGLYAALTGAPIGAGDQVISGIATHLLDEHAFLVNTSESIGAELSTLYSRNFERLLLAVELFQTDQVPLPPLLTRYGPLLDEAFAEPTAAAIVQRLRAATDPDVIHWAHRTAQLIETHCPLAVSATLRLLRELQSAPLADAIVLEHRVARRLGERGSVFDALRAIKIDDEPVKWRHASLDAVTTAELDALFAAPAANSAEHRLEAALVEWKLAEHVPKASQTLGPEPFIGLESPRTQLAHLISERLESVESLNSALSEVEGLTEDEEEKRLKFVPATRDDIREREQLMPVDRV